MTNSLPTNDPLKAAWLSQPVELTQMTATDLAAVATGFERKVRRRNLIEYIAGVPVVLGFGAFALFGRQGWISRGGDLVMIVGVLFVLWQLHKRGSPGRAPSGGSAESLLAFQRAQFVRQRDALKAVPVWYLLPMVPGFVVLGVGNLLEPHGHVSPQQNLAMVVTSWLVVSLVFVCVGLLNLWAAERLARAIDKIDALRRQ